MGEIKTVVLDLGGVFFSDGTKLAFVKMRDVFNVTHMKSLMILFSNSPKTIGRDIRLGTITMDEFEKELAKELKIPDDKVYLIRNLWFSCYTLNYKMDEIARQLSKKFRLIAFSGNIRERVEYLEKRYDFLRYFHDTVLSYDYQLNKGQIEFYEEMLKHLNCEPHEALMIDDEKKNNEKAKSLGLKTITYYYTEQLVDELKKFDININL
jgi:FMN phosphatase YigB (HAD superfamily)